MHSLKGFPSACLILLLVVPAICGAVDPQKPAVYDEADSYFERGETGKAIEAIKAAIAADPQNADAYDRLGYFLLKAGNQDEALRAFKTALGIAPGLRTSKTGVGIALLKKGDMKAAEAVLLDGLALNPYPAMDHYALGVLYEKSSAYEKSISQFKEGIRTFKAGKK